MRGNFSVTGSNHVADAKMSASIETVFAMQFIEPMMALRVPELPAGDWIYEMKFDCCRALAFKAGSEVRLLSRNRTLFNDNYPQLVGSLNALKAKSSIIDGEIASAREVALPAPPVLRNA